MLVKNGWMDFTYIKNVSDNGIDIIARGANGQLGFFEVKITTENIPNLLARQTNMNKFVDNVLSQAAKVQVLTRILIMLQDRQHKICILNLKIILVILVVM